MSCTKTMAVLAISCLSIAGCAGNQQTPLIFAQSQTVGISIGGGAGDQGADFVLGYKDKNIAIVPIAIQTGENSYSSVGSGSGKDFEDSYSVLGQFSVSTNARSADVGLGKFFATGAAAKALADGFSCKLAGDTKLCAAPEDDDSE